MAAPASMSPEEEAGLGCAAGLAGDESLGCSDAGLAQPMPTSRHTRRTHRLLRIKYLFMGTRLVTRIAGGAILVVVAN
jgi:hypothetical protein